jgi:hypothetical protein
MLHRLVSATGLAKRAYALPRPDDPDGPEGARPLRGRDRARLEHVRVLWARTDPRLVQVARKDLESRAGGLPPFWLGLVTVGRLLADADPHRVRWALQHLPYNAAKFTRARMTFRAESAAGAALIAWETRILRAAWDRLRTERRLHAHFGESP